MVQIAHIEITTPEQAKAIKAIAKVLKMKVKLEEKPYNPEFVAMIKQGEQDIKDGKGIVMTIEEIEALCK